MKTFDLYYRGNLTAVEISHPRELPKSASIYICDYLREDNNIIGSSVNVYQSIRKGGVKYWLWCPKQIVDTNDFI